MAQKIILTKKQVAYVTDNRFTMTGAAMARVLGFTKTIINQFILKNGLAIPDDLKEKLRLKALSAAYKIKMDSSYAKEKEFIREHYLTMPLKQIGAKFGHSGNFIKAKLTEMGLVIPEDILYQRRQDVRFKTGSSPPNKGKKLSPEQYQALSKSMFKKGGRSLNEKKIGSIQIRYGYSRSGRKQIRPIRWKKIGHKKWKEVHVINWEHANQRTVPAGHVIWFRNKDTLDVRIKNLELISQAESLKRNRAAFNELDPELKKAQKLVNKLTKKIYGKKQTNRSE